MRAPPDRDDRYVANAIARREAAEKTRAIVPTAAGGRSRLSEGERTDRWAPGLSRRAHIAKASAAVSLDVIVRSIAERTLPVARKEQFGRRGGPFDRWARRDGGLIGREREWSDPAGRRGLLHLVADADDVGLHGGLGGAGRHADGHDAFEELAVGGALVAA